MAPAAYAQARQTTDERVATSMRFEADDFERRLQRSRIRNTAPDLIIEIQRIGCAIAQERCSSFRFYVIETPEFNASMAPNGMMMINSGLLLRCESEAELAFVMAHEFHHFVDNDSVEMASRIRGANAGGLFIMIGLSVVGAGALGELGYLGAVANALAFSREQERDADMFASSFTNEHGYDSYAGVHLWERLRTEMLASSSEQTRKRFTSGSLFSTHPLTEERIAYLQAQPRLHPEGGGDAVRYRAFIRPHLRQWLEAEISVRDAGAGLALLERLAAPGADMGVIQYARGEIYRYRNNDGDATRALASYTEAVEHADAPPETWRQIGIMQHRVHNSAAADEAFSRYLSLATSAPDRLLIASMMSAAPPAAQPISNAAAP
jgi:predicted Zn-dependent protease